MRRFLMWLCDKGFYVKGDLSGALSIAQQSIDELPNCALLSDYLPGPRYRCRIACAHFASSMLCRCLLPRGAVTCPPPCDMTGTFKRPQKKAYASW